MTKEESLTWVKSLKPGDIVIYSGFGVAGRIQTAKVEKVTPSGHFELTHYTGDHWYLLDNTGRPWIEVVAWMPLPEPPKENQQHE